jgi:hypothetical protein
VGVRAVRSAPWVAALAAVVVLAARPLPAQDTTAVLRGVVMDTAGARVPYALVRILPSGTERFTDAQGVFAFTGLPLGTYRVQARQVGYEPFESAVSLRGEGAALRIALRPLTIRLDELTVTVPGRCTAPGPPDAGTAPALAAIFAQLRENARRFAVLADSYPFQYFLERTFTDVTGSGVVRTVATDTVEYQSSARVRYRPGEVIGWGTGLRGDRARVIQLPSLPDLADSAFIANHCFAFGGMVDRDSQRVLRVAFRVAEGLRTPDIDGDADLDPDSYQLRTLTIRLTRPDRAMPGLASASATIQLTELYSNLVVPGSVRGVLEPIIDGRFWSSRSISRYVDVQRLLRIHFLRAQPTDSTPSPQPSQ